MKIVKLTIRNFLGIKEADIVPGKITVLAGKNGQGKTSVLKAIEALFKGAPLSVVHQGTERAELVADLEDIKVTRIFTHKTSSVAVKNKDGFVRSAPQGFLDGLYGNFAFNPLLFLLADPKARRRILLKAMDVTVTAAAIEKDAGEPLPLPADGPALEMYAETRKFFYSRRTEVNRRLKVKLAAAGEVRKKLPEVYTPVEGIDGMAAVTAELISEKEAEIAGLEAEKKAAERAKETRAKLSDRIVKNERIAADGRKELEKMKDPDIETLRQKVEQLRALLKDAEAKLEEGVRQVREITDIGISIGEMVRTVASDKETLAALPGTFDTEKLAFEETVLAGLKGQRKDCDDEQARQRVWNEHVVLREEATEAEDEAGRLSALVERFGDELPAKALHEAKLPIEGLALDGEQVTVGGIPIDQLSTEEQIKITLSIARAMAKEVPLVCIDGVERLDDEHFAEFTKQAASDGFQYFVTRVASDDKEGKLILREGELGVAGGKVAAA